MSGRSDVEGVGSTRWALAAGDIPAESNGPEPEFTSHDRICVLNTGGRRASLEVTVYHGDREPVGPYRLTVEARRVRHVRVNDLIDPEPVPLGRPYGCVVRSDVPVVVQLLRQDTRRTADGAPAVTAVPLT